MENSRTHRDSVAAHFQEDQVATVLSMVHRMGHGHHVRLIRESGSALVTRLQRSGVPASFAESAAALPGTVVLIVDAPQQSGQVTDLLLSLGATRVERFFASSVTSSLLSFDTARLGDRPANRRSRGGRSAS